MVYNDTSTKQGLLQECEFFTNQQDGDIASNSTYTKQVFTNLLNRRYERAMGMLGASSRTAQADDTNYTDQPFSTFNIVSGQNDYQFLTDEDGNAITDITGVSIIGSADGIEFTILKRLPLDEDSLTILSQNTSNSGVPTGFIEQNNTIFFDKVPNYSKTAGGKLFYKRVPSYFTTSDTTKAPGFSADHHRILSLGASYDWLLVNKPDQGTLITRIEAELRRAEDEFRVWAKMRNPVKARMTTSNESTR